MTVPTGKHPETPRDERPAPPSRPPVPWHFKLIAWGTGVYVALRIVQMLGWIGVSVKEIHNALALAILLVNGVVAIWGLLAWRFNWQLINGYEWLALVGWYLYVPQIALGIALYIGGHRAPTGWQHYIYGLGPVIGIAIGSFYRRRLPGREGMLYGLVGLFLTGVAARAWMTGHG
jgi:hypothetical protein